MMTLADVLDGAADLIEPEGRWVRNWTAEKPDPAARNPADRVQALATDPKADKWGGTGAIYKVGREAGLTNADCHEAQRIAAASVGAGIYFSDWAWAYERTQGEVVNALRRAAHEARQQRAA